MQTSAPGKIVVWGEYAVLAGAPAAVMAVNRYAHVTLEPCKHHTRFTSCGFQTPGVYKADDTFCAAPTASMAELVLRRFGFEHYPTTFSLCSDTQEFFTTDGRKLGIGSSAALCTATYRALSELLDRPTSEAEAIDIHRSFQGGKGSGLDVAASWHGGVIRFVDGHGAPWDWPSELHWRVIWTNTSASTVSALGDFSQWREHNDDQELLELARICSTLFEAPTLQNLQHYAECLKALDESAGLNIYTAEHQRIASIASAHGLVYKPCGAGGGDIGLACGLDPQALDAFVAAAHTENFVSLHLEIASHGVGAG